MQVHTFTVGPFAENTYLLTEKGNALLIDPGFYEQEEVTAFEQKLETEQVALSAVLLTHAHVDHILGLQKVLKSYEVPVYLSNEDHYLWNNFSNQATMFGFKAQAFGFEPEPLPIQKKWHVDNFTFDTLYTPGHSPDHIALYNEENGLLIAGDALFREGIGRTDLYKGNFKLLEQSIKDKLYTLPDETKVYTGHGPPTTIGHEKKTNPFIRYQV